MPESLICLWSPLGWGMHAVTSHWKKAIGFFMSKCRRLQCRSPNPSYASYAIQGQWMEISNSRRDLFCLALDLYVRWMSFLKCCWLHKEFRMSSSDVCVVIKQQSCSGRLKTAEDLRFYIWNVDTQNAFLVATSWRCQDLPRTKSVDLLKASMPVSEAPWLPVTSTALGFPCSNEEKSKKHQSGHSVALKYYTV